MIFVLPSTELKSFLTLTPAGRTALYTPAAASSVSSISIGVVIASSVSTTNKCSSLIFCSNDTVMILGRCSSFFSLLV